MPYILNLIDKKTENVESVSDLFSGSGIVTRTLKKNGFKTISNDLMYFSYVILRGTVSLNYKPTFKKLNISNPIEYLNKLESKNMKIASEKLFIYNNYSPKGQRMYFTEKNAIKIDLIRNEIEIWKTSSKITEDEYYYLLACLLESVPYISNITGVYGAYLKHWDKRALNELELKELEIENNSYKNLVYNEDANVLTKEIECDLAYYDPPYNQRQYLPNYHILETIARYDAPIIKGVTGLRDYKKQKSKYCSKATVLKTFESLIKNTKSKYIIISYNTEGILSHDEICDILSRYGKAHTLYVQHIEYLRYKNVHTNKNKELKEILYFIEKEV